MQDFIWKMVGGDPFILHRSGKQSKYLFSALGVLFGILVLITFASFLGLFYGVFSSITPAFIGALVLTFVLKNLYRLVLISLEPSTLPVSKESKNKPWAYFVRFVVVFLIAVFVSKCMETMLFGYWVDDIIVEGDLQSYFGIVYFNKFEGSQYFIRHMKELNIHYPLINIFTLNMVGLYIIPIIIKHRLKKRNEYYQLRRQIDKKMVEEHHQVFLGIYTQLMENLYRNRYEVDKRLLKKDFDLKSNRYVYKYAPRYSDEPFNTKPINRNVQLATTKDFLDNF